jgi:hypothetical protein
LIVAVVSGGVSSNVAFGKPKSACTRAAYPSGDAPKVVSDEMIGLP